MDAEEADALYRALRVLGLRHRARVAELLAPLGLRPGQDAFLVELARTGPVIQAQLGEALGVEPPTVTVVGRKLEAAGHIRRRPAPGNNSALVVELTASGRALAGHVRELRRDLADEMVASLPAEAVAELPAVLTAMAGNIDTRRAGAPAAVEAVCRPEPGTAGKDTRPRSPRQQGGRALS